MSACFPLTRILAQLKNRGCLQEFELSFSARLHCVIQCVSQSEYQDFGGRACVEAPFGPPLFSTGSLVFEGNEELDARSSCVHCCRREYDLDLF